MKVICPKCNRIGYLQIRRKKVKNKIYTYYVVNHVNQTHYISKFDRLHVIYGKKFSDEYMKVIPFFGSLTYILPIIYKNIPPHEIFVDVFGGSGVVLLNKSPSKREIYNDKSKDMYNLFVCLRDHNKQLIEKFKYMIHSRELYNEIKHELLQKPCNPPDIDRAAKYLAWLCLCHDAIPRIGHAGFKVEKLKSSTRDLMINLVLSRLPKLINRLKRVIIENLDFRHCIQLYDSENTFFFLDPPHFGQENLYDCNFSMKDHEDLAKILHNIRGKFMLIYSYRTEQQRKWIYDNYGQYNIIEFEYKTHTHQKIRHTKIYMMITNY